MLSTILLFTLFAFLQTSFGFPAYSQHIKRQTDADQDGRVITFPAPDPDNSLKQIPDVDHPYIAPGPGDMRGPCPALNTLANHGYIPRDGIATPEQIFQAVTGAFNMGPTFAQFLISTATLARGNAFTGMISIGAASDRIPAIPGGIDGPVVGGIAKHGRFEGDLSSTREDADIGDSVNFQNDLFEDLLRYGETYGDLDDEGNPTIVTETVMSHFKAGSFDMFQQEDLGFELPISRQLTVFSEVSFMLNFFANGTDGTLSVLGLTSIFRNQTFPPNFYRRSSPAELDQISAVAGRVMNAIDPPIMPGKNVNGQYVFDQPVFTNFLCDAYADIMRNNIPYTFQNATGVLEQNVDTLTAAMYKPFHDFAGCTTKVAPGGQPGV